MKSLILAVAVSAALSACSDSREQQKAPIVDQPDRPLQVARPDTADTALRKMASRGNQPMSTVEQQPPRPAPAKARPAPRQRKRGSSPSKPRADTAAVRGYAPATAERDTATVVTSADRDTVSSADTTSAPPRRDTASASRADSATRDTGIGPVPASDTLATQRADTLATQRGDTAARKVARAPSDSVVKADTTVIADTGIASKTPPVADSTRNSNSTVVSRKPSPAPVANTTGFDAARRTLPVGTEIHAALSDSITSRRDTAGRSLTAEITQSVTGDGGKVLIPAGSTVRLTVTRIAAARSKSSQGRLRIKVDGIEVGGQLQTVQADLKPVPRELRGRGVTGSEAAKVGAGAAGGAVVGGVIGGNTKGAVIGGVIGAAGGAVVASQTATRDVVVKAKTPLTFVLTAPLVTP